jgi:hypothetical protein
VEYRLAKRNAVSNRKAYGTDPEFKKFWNAYNKSEAALKLEAAKAAAVAAANKASVANISAVNATAAAANAARAAAEARTHFNKTNRTTVLRSVRDAANTASKRAQASLAAAKKREAAAAAKTAANAKAAANKVAANAKSAAVVGAAMSLTNATRQIEELRNKAAKPNVTATDLEANLSAVNGAVARARTAFSGTNRSTKYAQILKRATNAEKAFKASLTAAKKRKANANKAASNKEAQITKLKKNISNARNAANKARQAVNASKAEAAAVKARNLRAQLNILGVDQEAKKVANQQVQEARGHADAAKKAAAQKTFNAELAQFIKVKSYATPSSLATILSRMKTAATDAGIANNNSRLSTAHKNQHEVAIKFFIQEVWRKTERGGKPGTNNVNRIAGSYGLAPLTNADRAIMNGLIPKNNNNVKSNSIIGWRRLQRSADADYNERVAELKNALGFPTPVSAPPPPPPGPIPGSRGAALLLPNKRGRPSTWTINQKFQNSYAKNNQALSNLYILSNNGQTYRKTNKNTGAFIDANVYNWAPSAQNFVKR